MSAYGHAEAVSFLALVRGRAEEGAADSRLMFSGGVGFLEHGEHAERHAKLQCHLLVWSLSQGDPAAPAPQP